MKTRIRVQREKITIFWGSIFGSEEILVGHSDRSGRRISFRASISSSARSSHVVVDVVENRFSLSWILLHPAVPVVFAHFFSSNFLDFFPAFQFPLSFFFTSSPSLVLRKIRTVLGARQVCACFRACFQFVPELGFLPGTWILSTSPRPCLQVHAQQAVFSSSFFPPSFPFRSL